MENGSKSNNLGFGLTRKVPIMLTVQQEAGRDAWLEQVDLADGCYPVMPLNDFYVLWCNEQGYFFDDMPA